MCRAEWQRERMGTRKYFSYVLHAAVLVGLAVAGMKYVNGEAFVSALERFNWVYAPFLLLLTMSYLLVKAGRFAYQLRLVTKTSRSVVMRGYIAAQAATLLPGGIAARAAILEQAGVPIEDSAAAIALSSFSDQFVLILCSLLSALWFDAARKPVLILLTILTLLSLLLGIEATRTWLLGVVEKILRRFHLLGYWRGFLDSLKEMSSPGVLLGAVANAALAAALMVVALDLTLRGLGVQVPYATELLAFTLPSLLGRISAMPGGVGVTEAGMVGVLDAERGVTLDQAAAAVMLFRLSTVLFGAVLGAAVYFFGWRGRAEAKRTSKREIIHERIG